MKWKVKPYPEIGDIKTIRKFAFLPVRMYNDEVVWLEFYYTDYLYRRLDIFARWIEMNIYQKN